MCIIIVRMRLSNLIFFLHGEIAKVWPKAIYSSLPFNFYECVNLAINLNITYATI